MNFGQILLSDEQIIQRKLFNKYLRRSNRIEQFIKDNKSKEIIKNKQLNLNIHFEFKY